MNLIVSVPEFTYLLFKGLAEIFFFIFLKGSTPADVFGAFGDPFSKRFRCAGKKMKSQKLTYV